MQIVWDFLVWLYTLPIDIWKASDRSDDWTGYVLAGVSILVIWGVTLLVLGLIIRGIYKSYYWRTHRQACQDCGDWTLGVANKTRGECIAGRPCCDDCHLQHEADAEKRLMCPEDQSIMVKLTTDTGHIHDKCPTCGGVWLSKVEVDAMCEAANDDGHSSGMLTGMVIGMAT